MGIEEENFGCYYGGKWYGSGKVIDQLNPTTGKPIAKVRLASGEDYENAIKCQLKGMNEWMKTPIPKRGEIIR